MDAKVLPVSHCSIFESTRLKSEDRPCMRAQSTPIGRSRSRTLYFGTLTSPALKGLYVAPRNPPRAEFPGDCGIQTYGGSSLRECSSFDTTEPMEGGCKVGSASWPVRSSVTASPCADFLCVTERIVTNLSACFAVKGRCSVTWSSGTLVGIVLKGLRNLGSQSGLGSKESIWQPSLQ